MTEPVYSVVIPVYNSAGTLERLNALLMDTLERTASPYEIIYTDDAGTDASWEVLKGLCARYKTVRAVRLAQNSGQWMALHAGTSVARGTHIIHMDDDLEYDPADVLLLIERYRRGNYRIVYGIPPDKSRKNLSNRLFFRFRSRALDLLLGKHKTESFRIFHYSVMLGEDRVPLGPWHFEAQAKRSVPQREIGYARVSYRNRPEGKSGYGWWKKFQLIARYGPEHVIRPRLTALAWGAVSAGFLLGAAYSLMNTNGPAGFLVGGVALCGAFFTCLIFTVLCRYLVQRKTDRAAYEIAEKLN